MADIRAFRGIRPRRDIAEKVAELPYDVVNSDEAREVTKGNPYSFYHITKPEIDLPRNIDPYHEDVYRAGKENLERFMKEGLLFQDEKPCLYLYTQVMDGRSQTGLMACVSIDDYIADRVKKHELTRKDKEEDRTRHLDILNNNTGLVFLIFKEDGSKKELFARAALREPEYDILAVDGIRHILRLIDDNTLIDGFVRAMKNDIFYIADGHHRAASAVNVGLARRKKNPSYTGEEEFNRFLAVIFPHDQLRILPYNRTVKDLNGLTEDAFIARLEKDFTVAKTGMKNPENTHSLCMYLSGRWHTLVPRFAIPTDPIDGLDVKIIQDRILGPVLGIKDPRTDKRVDFIGGIRGTAELEKLVNSGVCRVAFSMYPTTVEQLINVSDTGNIMPPKSTWFEPKLRDGLVTHDLG